MRGAGGRVLSKRSFPLTYYNPQHIEREGEGGGGMGLLGHRLVHTMPILVLRYCLYSGNYHLINVALVLYYKVSLHSIYMRSFMT